MQSTRRTFTLIFLCLVAVFLGFLSLRLLQATVTPAPTDFIRSHLNLINGQCPTVVHKIQFWTELTSARLTYDAAFDVFTDAEETPVVNVSDAIVLHTAMLEVMQSCEGTAAEIAFTEAGIVPWNEPTFAIPKTAQNTDVTSGFFAFVGEDMLRLSDNLLTSTRLRSAPLGPVNYWWYPLQGNLQTVRGYPMLSNVSFRPCLNALGSMQKCTPGDVPGSSVARAGVYAWIVNGETGSWGPVNDGLPPSADLAENPAVLTASNTYVRIRDVTVQQWNNGQWQSIGTLPGRGAAMVNHEGVLSVLSPDGRTMFTSTDGIDWNTQPITGIDFAIGVQSLLSKDGHLWIVGRRQDESRDRILVWPPVQQ